MGRLLVISQPFMIALVNFHVMKDILFLYGVINRIYGDMSAVVFLQKRTFLLLCHSGRWGRFSDEKDELEKKMVFIGGAPLFPERAYWRLGVIAASSLCKHAWLLAAFISPSLSLSPSAFKPCPPHMNTVTPRNSFSRSNNRTRLVNGIFYIVFD